ncbi:MAG: class I SAM-dependent methyltransferase [Alphaproteobacteria bacterium]|nr:class I SAM-dependent methyltransferase [Alphaproteobacteria bacterium]
MPKPDEPPRYSPKVFDVATAEAARAIILQAEDPTEVERRWSVETPWFGRLIRHACALGPESRVLDFGCGLGRLSKWLIDAVGCRVVGVDISEGMRKLAADYVGSAKFSAVAYEAFRADPAWGGGFDAAFACYVLQHVERPDQDLPAIAAALRPGGRFLLANSQMRWVPTTQGWARDHFDVVALANASFVGVEGYVFPPEIAVLPGLDAETVLHLYRRP